MGQEGEASGDAPSQEPAPNCEAEMMRVASRWWMGVSTAVRSNSIAALGPGHGWGPLFSHKTDSHTELSPP